VWRILVERTCIGSGSCVGISPAHFELGGDNRSHPLAAEVTPNDVVLDAAASCPVEAIRIQDAETGEPVEP
jgi:ferredoxin